MRIILAATILLCCAIDYAAAQYGPGPWIDPGTGHRYYVPRGNYPGREYFSPRRDWYNPRMSWRNYGPGWDNGPYRQIYPPRINCYGEPWRCPGPP